MGFELQCKELLNYLDLSNLESCEYVIQEAKRLHSEKVKNISFLTTRDRRVLRETGLNCFNRIFQQEDQENDKSAITPRVEMYRALVRSRAVDFISLSLAGLQHTQENRIMLIKINMRTGNSFSSVLKRIQQQQKNQDDGAMLVENKMGTDNSEAKTTISMDGLQKNIMYHFITAERLWEEYLANADVNAASAEEANAELVFTLFSWFGEALWQLNKFAESIKALQRAVAVVGYQSTLGEALNLSQVLYNKGVELYNTDCFDLASQTLELSHSAAKLVSVEKYPHISEKRARTLRVLALTYSDLKVHSKAFGALEQALEIQPANAEALHIKTRLLFQLQRNAEAEANMLKTLQTSEFDITLGLGMIEYASDANASTEFLLRAFDALCNRFPGNEILVLQRFKLLGERNELAAALSFMATAFNDSISKSTLSDILTIAWSIAVAFFERKAYAQAGKWLEKILFLANAMDSTNITAQAYRAISLAFFMAKEYEQSDSWCGKARQLEPRNKCAHILNTMSLLHHNHAAAASLFRDMLANHRLGASELCLIAQESMDQNVRSVTMRALDELLQHSEDDFEVSKLTMLRNAITLACTSPESGANDEKSDGDSEAARAEAEESEVRLEGYFDRLCKHLPMLQMTNESQASGVDHCSNDELQWLANAAHTAGLRNSEAKRYTLACSFFSHVFTILKRLPVTAAGLNQSKQTLILGACVALQSGWLKKDKAERDHQARLALSALKTCRTTLQQRRALLESNSSANEASGPSATDNSTACIMATLEMKACLFLQDSAQIIARLETLAQEPFTTSHTFEVLTQLAMEFDREDICVACIKHTITKELATQVPDYHKVTTLIRTVIAMHDSSQIEALKLLFEDVQNHCSTHSPHANSLIHAYKSTMEGRWLVDTVWNHGTRAHRRNDYFDAMNLLLTAQQLQQTFFGTNSSRLQEMKNACDEAREQHEKLKEQSHLA